VARAGGCVAAGACCDAVRAVMLWRALVCLIACCGALCAWLCAGDAVQNRFKGDLRRFSSMLVCGYQFRRCAIVRDSIEFNIIIKTISLSMPNFSAICRIFVVRTPHLKNLDPLFFCKGIVYLA